jgi:hypothetical protein
MPIDLWTLRIMYARSGAGVFVYTRKFSLVSVRQNIINSTEINKESII